VQWTPAIKGNKGSRQFSAQRAQKNPNNWIDSEGGLDDN
jgi:hypothetical protein